MITKEHGKKVWKEDRTKDMHIKKAISIDDYDELERFFKKIDKIWQEEFGIECPSFCPSCPQCKFALIYNKFKQDVFDEVLK